MTAKPTESAEDDTTSSPQLPDSNGFWRDVDGDIWAYDGNTDHPPFYLFDNELQRVYNNQFPWVLTPYAPFTKISNPFPEGDHHAD